jgi:hypothetical protein
VAVWDAAKQAGVSCDTVQVENEQPYKARPTYRTDHARCNNQSKPMKISPYLRIPPTSEEHVPVVVIVAHGHGFPYCAAM